MFWMWNCRFCIVLEGRCIDIFFDIFLKSRFSTLSVKTFFEYWCVYFYMFEVMSRMWKLSFPHSFGRSMHRRFWIYFLKIIIFNFQCQNYFGILASLFSNICGDVSNVKTVVFAFFGRSTHLHFWTVFKIMIFNFEHQNILKYLRVYFKVLWRCPEFERCRFRIVLEGRCIDVFENSFWKSWFSALSVKNILKYFSVYFKLFMVMS